jgi:Cft2 family RNA processing exonuclease
MLYPEIRHYGATEGITGSCHQRLISPEHSFLIDCGSFQGDENSRGDRSAIEFSIDTIKALVVTHVHADHVGRTPQLLVVGYTGQILCSEPSAQLETAHPAVVIVGNGNYSCGRIVNYFKAMQGDKRHNGRFRLQAKGTSG